MQCERLERARAVDDTDSDRPISYCPDADRPELDRPNPYYPRPVGASSDSTDLGQLGRRSLAGTFSPENACLPACCGIDARIEGTWQSSQCKNVSGAVLGAENGFADFGSELNLAMVEGFLRKCCSRASTRF